MYKTVRSLALVFVLAVAAVPAVKADRWGTNPMPTGPGVMDTMGDAVLFNLGML